MENPPDSNAAIWKSAEGVDRYVAGQQLREEKRRSQWRLMGELLPYLEDEPFTLLDIGAGTGPAARAVLDLFPRCTAVLADFSAQMMDEAIKVMEPYAGRYTYIEFDMTDASWPSALARDFGAVVTSQCVHHVDDSIKRQLFAGVFEHLRPGGWYLNFDPIVADDAQIASAWQRANERQDPVAAEREEHRTHEELLRYENHVRYMTTLGPQLELLADAGFGAIDVYWKHLDYVIYGGAKPAR